MWQDYSNSEIKSFPPAENLVEDLLGDFEYDVQIPYLLYRNVAEEVNGIWFYDTHECEAVGNLFGRYKLVFQMLMPFTLWNDADLVGGINFWNVLMHSLCCLIMILFM